MKERPILFSGPMVKAILDGTKTQTRRLVKPQPINTKENGGVWYPEAGAISRCPLGIPGDRLWVRETFGYDNHEYVEQYKREPWMGMPSDITAKTHYLATECAPEIFPERYWKPSIHMPRWASRITLEVTNVWVERLHEIGEVNAKAEGFTGYRTEDGAEYTFKNADGSPNRVLDFEDYWRGLHGPESWESNPWVWVINFKRVGG